MKLVINEDIWIDDIGIVIIEFKCEDNSLPHGELRSKSTADVAYHGVNNRTVSLIDRPNF